jgi:LPXTG-motif cell wall-anchored protein
MQIAMSSVLTMVCWRDFLFFNDFSSRDFAWLLIGVVLAVVGMWVLSRRRRRWF